MVVVVGDVVAVVDGVRVVVVIEGIPPWLPVNNAMMPQMIRMIRIAMTTPNRIRGLRYQAVDEDLSPSLGTACSVGQRSITRHGG